MAAITGTAITAIAAGTSLYMSAKQAKDGKEQARKAQDAIDNYKRQKLENPYANLRVSTMSADLAREESARNYANSIGLLKSAGTTGLGILPALTASTNTMNRQIGADLDRQFVMNENAKAGGNVWRTNMQEQREIADLAGLGTMMNMGIQNRYAGNQGVANAMPMFANSAMGLYNTSNNQIGQAGRVNYANNITQQSQEWNNFVQPAGYDFGNYDPSFNSQLLPFNSIF